MDAKERIILENFEEYFNQGLESFKNKRFNTASTLFFKAIAALCDIYIIRKEGIVPSSHIHRFRILEKYQELYKIVDRDFPFYQDSYTHRIDEESAKLLKEDAERIKKIVGV